MNRPFAIRRRGTRRLAGASAVIVAVTLVGACGRSGSSSGTPHSGPSTSGASGSSAPTSAPATAGPGDFGTLKAICGAGSAKGATGRGVTDTEIHIGVTADPGAAAAPGLEQEFFDTAEGFSKWCNAAGGINGRKIVVDKLDAKLFNVGQVMTQACQRDFMLVGNGNAFDSAGVKIREACGLGQIPAYVTSPQAVDATLQAQASPIPSDEVNDGAMRLLAQAYPTTKVGGVAIGSSTLSSIIPTGLKAKEYLTDIGVKVAAVQNQPPAVDNYRPYVEQWKQSGAVGIYQISAQDPTPIVQAMKNVGYTPGWILYSTQFYGPQAAQAAKALGSFPPSYVQFNAIPFDLANKFPVVQQLIDIVHGAVPNGKLTTFTLSSMSAWLLWAKSAKACGSTLTVACVLKNAQTDTAWDAGGLYPKQDLRPGHIHASNCIAIVKLTNAGFVYDEQQTKPTSGDAPFNCDPANVEHVKTYIQG
jgi:ABC-type branched-subunit amino acid transport system substrate-binding protein